MTNIRTSLLAVGALLVGCGHTTWVTVAADPSQSAAAAGPAVMTATGAPWEAEPDDLTDHLLVVSVELFNQGPQEVRVAYTDFALTDEAGVRYGAINPFAAATTTGALERQDAVTDGTQVAWRGGGRGFGGGRGYGGGRSYGGPRVRVYSRPRSYGGSRVYGGGRIYGGPRVYRGPRVGFTPRAYWPGRAPGLHGRWYVRPPRYRPRYGLYAGRWSGFVPVPGLQPWYGTSFSYWHTPFFLGPSYFVGGWSPGYYPAERPPEDMINLALPEGVLQAGGKLDGFLYFQPPPEGSGRIALTWTAVDSQTGQPLGQGRVELAVIKQD